MANKEEKFIMSKFEILDVLVETPTGFFALLGAVVGLLGAACIVGGTLVDQKIEENKSEEAAPMVGEKIQASILAYLAETNKVDETAKVSILSAIVDKTNGDVYARFCIEENGIKSNKFMLIETNLSDFTRGHCYNHEIYEMLDGLEVRDCHEISTMRNSMEESQYNAFCKKIIGRSKLTDGEVINATEYGSNENENESEFIILKDEKIYFGTYDKGTNQVNITKEEKFEEWSFHLDQLERNVEDFITRDQDGNVTGFDYPAYQESQDQKAQSQANAANKTTESSGIYNDLMP